MEKNDDYFDNKSESEIMRNVANMVNDIVNAKPEEEIVAVIGEGDGTDEDPKPEEPEVNPLVDAVGKAISNHKPRGMFMQGIQPDDHPKL